MCGHRYRAHAFDSGGIMYQPITQDMMTTSLMIRSTTCAVIGESALLILADKNTMLE